MTGRACLAVAAFTAAFFMPTAALAHDWYVGKTDPVTGGSCCTTSSVATTGDCGVLKIQKGMLEAEDLGYRLRLTADQASQINPLRHAPVDTLIPWDRIQLSGDGNYHVCLPQHPYVLRSDFYCFFAPGSI
jgi:hypothetical protein